MIELARRRRQAEAVPWSAACRGGSQPEPSQQPEGNGCAERFIRTLKENLLWLSRFETIEELRQALHAFKDTYNRTWIVQRHGYRTPAQVRADQIGLPEAA